MLMRQYTRAALCYLFLQHDLIVRHKAILVPLSEWITHGAIFQQIYKDLDPPSPNVVQVDSVFQTMKKKLSIYNRSRLNGGDNRQYPDAVSILEASAILLQERTIAENFGASYIQRFRRGISERGAAETYYGALAFISGEFGARLPAEIVSYLLLACLCGNFQDTDTRRAQYPTDILVELIAWLRHRNIELADIKSFEEVIYIIDEYFQETHSGDVMDMMAASVQANKAIGDALKQELNACQERLGDEYPGGRELLQVYDNFCEAHTRFIRDVCVNPLWYCSSKYLEIQRRLPTPVIFIESELGVPVTKWIEERYYIQCAERIYLADLPEEDSEKFKHLASDGEVIQGAHVLSPRGFKTEESAASVGEELWHMKNSSGAINVELWQRNHDAVGSLLFLIEGPGTATSKQVQRDLMSGFTLVDTKVYTAEGEIKGELFDPHKVDPEVMKYIEELRKLKS